GSMTFRVFKEHRRLACRHAAMTGKVNDLRAVLPEELLAKLFLVPCIRKDETAPACADQVVESDKESLLLALPEEIGISSNSAAGSELDVDVLVLQGRGRKAEDGDVIGRNLRRGIVDRVRVLPGWRQMADDLDQALADRERMVRKAQQLPGESEGVGVSDPHLQRDEAAMVRGLIEDGLQGFAELAGECLGGQLTSGCFQTLLCKLAPALGVLQEHPKHAVGSTSQGQIHFDGSKHSRSLPGGLDSFQMQAGFQLLSLPRAQRHHHPRPQDGKGGGDLPGQTGFVLVVAGPDSGAVLRDLAVQERL